jgi:hypothetical protein
MTTTKDAAKRRLLAEMKSAVTKLADADAACDAFYRMHNENGASEEFVAYVTYKGFREKLFSALGEVIRINAMMNGRPAPVADLTRPVNGRLVSARR